MYALKEHYNNQIKQELTKQLEIKNPMLLPKLEKIVISVGAGQYAKEAKILQNIADTISLIAGQKNLPLPKKRFAPIRTLPKPIWNLRLIMPAAKHPRGLKNAINAAKINLVCGSFIKMQF